MQYVWKRHYKLTEIQCDQMLEAEVAKSVIGFGEISPLCSIRLKMLILIYYLQNFEPTLPYLLSYSLLEMAKIECTILPSGPTGSQFVSPNSFFLIDPTLLFKVMTLPAIPIVLGSADYSKLAPQNSLLDISKFDSAKDLANYLHFLISDGQEPIIP